MWKWVFGFILKALDFLAKNKNSTLRRKEKIDVIYNTDNKNSIIWSTRKNDQDYAKPLTSALSSRFRLESKLLCLCFDRVS